MSLEIRQNSFLVMKRKSAKKEKGKGFYYSEPDGFLSTCVYAEKTI
jgi:hypothetical protein